MSAEGTSTRGVRVGGGVDVCEVEGGAEEDIEWNNKCNNGVQYLQSRGVQSNKPLAVPCSGVQAACSGT